MTLNKYVCRKVQKYSQYHLPWSRFWDFYALKVLGKFDDLPNFLHISPQKHFLILKSHFISLLHLSLEKKIPMKLTFFWNLNQCEMFTQKSKNGTKLNCQPRHVHEFFIAHGFGSRFKFYVSPIVHSISRKNY